MNAENSILVTKSPSFSRTKITKTNRIIGGKDYTQTTGHSAGRRVTITTNGTDSPKQRQPLSPPDTIIPTPDYSDEGRRAQTDITEVINFKM